MACSLAFQSTDLAACLPNSTIFSVQYTTLILTLLTLFSLQRIPSKSFGIRDLSHLIRDFKAKRGRDSELYRLSVGFRNPGKFCLWNPEYSSRNSEFHLGLESRIQAPLIKTGIEHSESGIQSIESRIQDFVGFP